MQGTKYIFVTGGVTSSLGKGIISASLGKLLKSRSFNVTIQKLDPYINVDPGTLNPYEHGECYVTEDGAETDLDLGHYERFLNQNTSQINNITTGSVYQYVIRKEREGKFLGKTVQVIPHITDEIKRRIQLLAKKGDYDFIICEIGGTVGDIESLPYLEAVRQLKWELGKNNSLVIHLTLVPYLSSTGELKTKPTQHSVKHLLQSGIQADIIVCRTKHPLNEELRLKISRFCNVEYEAVIEAIDTSTIYELPFLMKKERLDEVVLKKLNIENDTVPDLKYWEFFLKKLKSPSYEINIALIGKYTELKDAYKSIAESFIHAGAANDCSVNIKWLHSEYLNKNNISSYLSNVNGILVAPGFGERGIEGKIEAIKYARENNIPFLGICLGMQCAVIEFARNVLNIKDANSLEFEPNSANHVITLMDEQKNITNKGGTMRLGAYKCKIKKNTLAWEVFKKEVIKERHRHRYEFNNDYLNVFEEAGMLASGINPDNNLIEIIELRNHPWFMGVQFHPEYKSTVESPHPLFVSFVKAAIDVKVTS